MLSIRPSEREDLEPSALEVLSAEIGHLCRCMACCCPPGTGHRHPRFGQYEALLDAADER